MPLPYVLAVLLIVLLAGAVVAVVAISSGHFDVKRPGLRRLAQRTEEVLEAEGETPRFLERLDQRHGPVN